MAEKVTPDRPYYTIPVELNGIEGWSVVRNLEDGGTTDWTKLGVMSRNAAKTKRNHLNDRYEQKYYEINRREHGIDFKFK